MLRPPARHLCLHKPHRLHLMASEFERFFLSSRIIYTKLRSVDIHKIIGGFTVDFSEYFRSIFIHFLVSFLDSKTRQKTLKNFTVKPPSYFLLIYSQPQQLIFFSLLVISHSGQHLSHAYCDNNSSTAFLTMLAGYNNVDAIMHMKAFFLLLRWGAHVGFVQRTGTCFNLFLLPAGRPISRVEVKFHGITKKNCTVT